MCEQGYTSYKPGQRRRPSTGWLPEQLSQQPAAQPRQLPALPKRLRGWWAETRLPGAVSQSPGGTRM